MSRPKPTILLEHTDRKTYKSEQVLAAEGIWAVFYKNKPFNLKSAMKQYLMNFSAFIRYISKWFLIFRNVRFHISN